MSKQLPIVIGGLILVAIIGVVAFTQLKKPQQPEQATTATQEQSQASQSSKTRGSIKSLLGIGKNVTCDITYPDGNGSGTTFIADKKMRGDFTMMVDKKEMENHMIQDGDTTYFWSGTQGTKMKIDDSVKVSPSPATGQQSQGADINKDVDYKCSSWSVDNSKFTPPADVSFTDMSALMDKMKQTQPATGQEPGTTKSSYCDQITDPAAKAACISASGGN